MYYYLGVIKNNKELKSNQEDKIITAQNKTSQENKIINDQNETSIQEENKNGKVNKFVSLSIESANKKIADNRETYYVNKQSDNVALSIRDGKVYFTSWFDQGINENELKVSKAFEKEITGFNKKVIDAEICCWQTTESRYFVFLMEDGTLEYSSIKNILTKLTTEGKVPNVSNIQRIDDCSVILKNEEGSIDSIVALDYENNLYDIGYILYK